MVTIKSLIPVAVALCFSYTVFAATAPADSLVTPSGSPPPANDTNIVSQAERLPLQFIQSAKVAFKNRDLQKTSDNLIGAARAVDANSKSSSDDDQISSDSLRALSADVLAKKEISIDEFSNRLSPLLAQESSVQRDRANFLWGRSETHATGSALNLAADYLAEASAQHLAPTSNYSVTVADAKLVAGQLMANSGWKDGEVRKTLDGFSNSLASLNKSLDVPVKSATTRSADTPQ